MQKWVRHAGYIWLPNDGTHQTIHPYGRQQGGEGGVVATFALMPPNMAGAATPLGRR